MWAQVHENEVGVSWFDSHSSMTQERWGESRTEDYYANGLKTVTARQTERNGGIYISVCVRVHILYTHNTLTQTNNQTNWLETLNPGH